LKPLEQIWGVRGVAAEKYPINKHCAHPGCNEPVHGAHHVFPRSMTKSDSYFVEITQPDGKIVIPHAVGLCGSGTTGHHGAVEHHDAWIKLEDGVFVWYERKPDEDSIVGGTDWRKLGPLNPQPGSQDARRKRPAATGKARRQRKMIGFKVPKEEQEDGAGILEDLHLQVEEKMGFEEPRSLYYSIVDSFSYVLLHADETDFVA
jgi:hypothetical protein